MVPTLSAVTSLALSLVLSVKLLEMLWHSVVVWRLPGAFVDDLGDAADARQQDSAIAAALEAVSTRERRAWAPEEWPFTGRIWRMRPGLLRLAGVWIFRWPVLMAAQAVVVLVGRQRVVVAVGSFLLLAGVWVELLQRFVFRLRLGYMDSYLRKTSAARLHAVSSPAWEPPYELDLARDFVFLFVRLVAMVILGYAAVYSALQRTVSPGAFKGQVGEGFVSVLSLLYFSIVTIATVGYGDIVPETPLARFLVATEIMAGFALLVLLITTFSLTTSPTRAGSGGRRP
jgi:hypothetical protein